MSTKSKYKQEIQATTILQDFLLILLFKELEDGLLLLLITLLLMFLIIQLTILTRPVLRNSHTKYFLPRVNITNYNVLINRRNFYDRPINDQIKKYDEIRKNCDRARGWLHNRMFVRLSVPQGSLKSNCTWS